ncbi:MAG: aldo/keto reductase [Rhodoglobus sp.]|nr:aldo/keto reductase [Rhodoglobus sp.]
MTLIEFRPLGASGPQVSTIGLGCNNFGRPGSLTEGQEGTTAVIDKAIELGVTLLDTADIYGVPAGTSETLMGVALKGRRDRVVLATKFGHDAFETGLLPGVPKGSREYIRAAIDESLRRLQTDHVDLYQQHVPDPATPIEETLGALDELVTEGKVLFVGSTQFSATQLRAADAAASATGSARFVSAQSEYSLLNRAAEHDVLPAARELGLGFLPFFPLANGLLTGKFTRTERPADTRIMRQRPQAAEDAPWDRIERYAAWCAENEATMLEATFGWLLAQPGLTSVIAGVTRPEQLAQNVAAAAWKPSAGQVAEISAIFG